MDSLAYFFVHLVEILFFFGIVGSSGVVILSLIQDLHELLQKDEPL